MAGGDRLRRIEDGEVPADDLVGGVLVDALGAGVPRGDAPVGVEHEDGVVGDAVDDAAKAVGVLRGLVAAGRGRQDRGALAGHNTVIGLFCSRVPELLNTPRTWQ